MRSTWFTRGARAVLALAAVAVVVGVTPAAAKPKPGVKRTNSNLFALTAAIMQVNHQYCPVINTGNVCTDPSGNGVIEGGFWPKGTPDSYIFNSGLQIGGVIPQSAGFGWAGDTVGAFFMDPRGDQADGSPITLVYNSLDAGDASSWPAEGVVADTGVYNQVFTTGAPRNAVSQQDLWFRAWDGNPTRLGGRAHPAGIMVETRGMAWNYPTGNDDIIYFVYTFFNVTSSDPNDYANPTVPNQSASYRAGLASLGTQFQQLNQTKYGISFPTHGFEIDSLFAAFFEDCDVGTDHVGANYSTPVFPFAMGVCYEAPFNEVTWTSAGSYTGANGAIFTPPTFAAAPGFTSVKYLKSPINPATGREFGISMFSNTLNSGTGYPDPVGVKQMYRYLAGQSAPAGGDNPCSFQGEQQHLHYCYLAQVSADTRFFESSGPFTLLPGHAATIVVGYINAAPVNTPFLQTQIGGDFKPGFGATGDSINKDPSAVRQIERVMGWVSQADSGPGAEHGDGIIEQDEVKTVPRSLLDKASVAQAVFDSKFLLPFAPDAPQFFLIPGDNQVTIVWQKSPTDAPTGGDPYFVVASDPTNLLYDPDFRHFDVEGYRIYRGRTPGALSLVAQFDYSGTSFVDYTGQVDWGNCAPELGVDSTKNGFTCPTKFQTSAPFDSSKAVPLVGPVVQVPAGGRVKLSDGSVLVLRSDTAVTGGGSGLPALSDNGVTFAFVDRGVRNEFQYFYSVTAFDINSLKSGPSSLESARSTKTTTPRAAGSSSVAAGGLSPIKLLGNDGVALSPSQPVPAIDPNTGEFAGPMPPTNGLTMGFAAFLPALVDTGSMTMRVDSVKPDTTVNTPENDPPSGGGTQNVLYYMTASGSPIVLSVPISHDVDDHSNSTVFAGTKVNQKKGAVYGGDSSFSLLAQVNVGASGTWYTSGTGRCFANSGGACQANMAAAGGPRWWEGSANENVVDPNIGMCSPSICAAGLTFAQATAQPTAGAMADLTALMTVQAYSTVTSNPMRDIEVVTAGVYRGADFAVFWGTGGVIDSVKDVTHHVLVPFKPDVQASWGILDTASYRGVPNASNKDGNSLEITWSDIACLTPFPAMLATATGCKTGPRPQLQSTAHLSPIAVSGQAFASAAPAPTGNGFIFYLAGKFFLMQMTALPAAGSVWHARYPLGNILGSTGSYGFQEVNIRGAAIPNLTWAVSFQGSSPADVGHTTDAQLALVHTVPDPYYVTNALEITPNNKVLKFVNLPGQAIVRIYSVSGILVQVLTHNDPTGGGELDWDLRNRSNQFVASGVYFYHVEAADGKTKVGRFTVVQFAP